MAKAEENTAVEEPAATTSTTEAPKQQQQQAPVQVQVKDDDANSAYANFCRVTGSPEELIVELKKRVKDSFLKPSDDVS